MGNNNHLKIFDTTLRDGEQSPGASMTLQEKVTIAKALEKLNVDIIEAGFPVSSPGDFAAVQAVSKVIKNSTICGLARAVDGDIEAAAEALKPASSMRIHTFIATSPIHMKHKLQLNPEEVIERAVRAVKKARQYTDDVEFSPEDAGRSDIDFLCKILERVIDAGATTLNIPDTVGYTLPEQYGSLIKTLIDKIPNSDKAIFSSHCHNDLGLAVANSLEAVKNGARQVECTINGLGERAGNASLEEVVMAIRTRKDYFPCTTRIDTTQIVNCSQLVSNITGFAVQPNKAIVGINAFAHEAGIHQDGVLKSRETYEIMRAEDVGWTTNRMVLGKHSGRNAFTDRLKDLGVEFESDKELNAAFAEFKVLADKKHDIYDEDLLNLVSGTNNNLPDAKIKLIGLRLHADLEKPPLATVTLRVEGKERTHECSGNGPVDASFKAIERIVNSGCNLQFYNITAMHSGPESQGLGKVRLEKDGVVSHGQGMDTDIVFASVKAYVDALNMMHYQQHNSSDDKAQANV